MALIDTGVVAMQDQTLSELKRGQIKPGISFVRDLGDEDRGSHWWLPSDEHGSQMAHLICSLDPYCELYPAQVAYGRELNTVYSVVEVRLVHCSMLLCVHCLRAGKLPVLIFVT